MSQNSKKLQWLAFLYSGCCICRTNLDLTVHHVNPQWREDKNSLEKSFSTNLALICDKCHNDYHKKYHGDDVNRETFVQYVKENRKIDVTYVVRKPKIRKKINKFRNGINF